MPRHSRQYHIGPSPTKMPCLVSPPPQPPLESLGKCYVSTLPDELLANIFAFLSPEINLYHPPTYETCPPIPIICKQWERIYDATLYETVSFVDHDVRQERRNSNVVKALRQRPDLCRHVRNIFVQMWEPSEATRRFITDIISSCRAVRNVSLRLGWSANTWPIIQAVGMLPRLKGLRLSGNGIGPFLHMIPGLFNQPTLRDIRLSRYGLSRGDSTREPWSPTELPSKDDLDGFSVVAHSHSSAITSLELSDPRTSPQCTGILLKWPSKLVRLSLSRFYNSGYCMQYTRERVENLLSIHRESLQQITVGIIPEKQNQDNTWIASGIPNFATFQCLNELQVSAYNLLAETPSEAAAKLAAPALRHLTMSFCTEDYRSEARGDFREHQALWMADFAAQKSTTGPHIGLQTVYIDINPYRDPRTLRSSKGILWPWEFLQQAEEQMARYNIVMKYNNPRCTKDEWAQSVAGHQMQ